WTLCTSVFHTHAAHAEQHSFPHDALPIWPRRRDRTNTNPADQHQPNKKPRLAESGFFVAHPPAPIRTGSPGAGHAGKDDDIRRRSEEHTSELQSRENLVCRLLLEKKKNHI